MQIEFDLTGLKVTMVEEPAVGDRALKIVCAAEDGDVMRITFAGKKDEKITPLATVTAAKAETGVFAAAIPDAFFEHDGVCVLGVTLVRTVQEAGGSWSGFVRYGVLEFEAISEAGEKDLQSVSLIRNLSKYIEELELNKATVTLTCDREGNIWKLFYSGDEVVRTDLSAEIRGKMARDEALDVLDRKADTSYVDAELAKKASSLQLNAKADRHELEALVLSNADMASVTYVNAELNKKADADYVTTELNKKASVTQLNAKADKSELEALVLANAGMASVAYVNTELNKKADTSYVTTELNKKASVTQLNAKADKSELDALAQSNASMASVTYVNTELNKKSDKSYVDSELNKKANASDVTTELNKKSSVTQLNAKADKSELEALALASAGMASIAYVDSELNKKANASDVTTELNKKANVTQLNAKADKSELEALLMSMADSASLGYVNTELNKKASISYVDGVIKGTVLYDAASVLSSENLGYMAGLSGGTSIVINAGDYRELKIIWQTDTNASCRVTTVFQIPGENSESAISNLNLNPADISTPLKAYVSTFKLSGTKTTFTTSFHTVNLSTAAVTVDTKSTVRKIIAYK